VLRYPLTHPGLLAALAGAGHGSKVLLADGNYPVATGVAPRAAVVHLNLRPGLIGVEPVLETLLSAVAVEQAEVMHAGAPPEPEVFGTYRRLLAGVPLHALSRNDFYAAARGPDTCLVVATGEQRLYANVLLTLGVLEGEPLP
jgi:L-fucose mutarotase